MRARSSLSHHSLYCVTTNTLINVADFVAQLELSEGVVALPVTSEILSCDCYTVLAL